MQRLVFSDVKSNQVYRFKLHECQLQKASDGKWILPENVSSAGFFERVSDGNWDSLPEISIEKALKECPCGDKRHGFHMKHEHVDGMYSRCGICRGSGHYTSSHDSWFKSIPCEDLCKLCGEYHLTENHVCSVCNTKGHRGRDHKCGLCGNLGHRSLLCTRQLNAVS